MKTKKSVVLLVVSLLLIFVGSFIAYQFNSSSGDVDVSRVYFDTPSGELSGLLYKPDGADDDPRPTIIATHGYLNSAEMQDGQAIEMSKRGYVVLALDQYDHGHSTGTMEKPVPFFSFWPSSIYDAVQYMYDQQYVLKDDDGNGLIAVSGHSMGGFSSTNAVILDELDFEQNGFRKVHAYLTMGSDYQWIYLLEHNIEDIVGSYGPRFAGKIAANYDEFFFNAADAAPGETVVRKDYVGTEEGQAFLGNPEDPKPSEAYQVDDGVRIIYQPNEIHPWNHFSKTTTGYVIDFYDMAFANYDDLVATGEQGQTWMYKEWFSFVALIGFFMLFVPVINMLTRLPFLNKVMTTKPAPLPEAKTTGAKVASLLIILFGALFPALFFPALYSGEVFGARLLRQVSLILIVISAIAFIYTLVKNREKRIQAASISVFILSLIQYIYLRQQSTLIDATEFLGAPTANPIVYWAINVALVTLIIMVCYHFISKKEDGATIENYGVKVNVQSIIAALVTAVIALIIGYGVLYLIDALFKTDFRLWTFAVKTFEPKHVVALLKYAPLFFIYFFVVGLSANINTASERFNGIKGYITSILLFIGGLLLYLGYQYGLLFVTGTAGYPNEALSSILVIGLVPVLFIAAVFNRYFFLKTGNVYVGSFLNTLLMTLITLANTALYTVF